jgi:uncharacterized membrane protein YcfT
MHSTLGVGLAVDEIDWLHGLVAFAKPFRMPDFFLIASLFFGSAMHRPWRQFLDGKVLHFVYFYALWLFIALVLKATALGIVSPAAFLQAYLWAFIEPFSSLWFIHLLPVLFIATRLVAPLPALPVLILALALHGAAAAYPEGGIYAMASEITPWTTLNSFMLFWIYFLAGFYFRDAIFRFADQAAGQPRRALFALMIWVFVQAGAVAWGLPEILGLDLVFGFVGALVVVAGAALIARFRPMAWLAFLGRHSLVIYLSFFVPMALVRTVLVKTSLVDDTGTMSLLVTLAAITGPLALFALVRRTPFNFLFARPRWARL